MTRESYIAIAIESSYPSFWKHASSILKRKIELARFKINIFIAICDITVFI